MNNLGPINIEFIKDNNDSVQYYRFYYNRKNGVPSNDTVYKISLSNVSQDRLNLNEHTFNSVESLISYLKSVKISRSSITSAHKTYLNKELGIFIDSPNIYSSVEIILPFTDEDVYIQNDINDIYNYIRTKLNI